MIGKIFGKHSSYGGRGDVRTWNRSSLLRRIKVDLEAKSLNVTATKSQLHIQNGGHIWLEFDQQEYVEDNLLSFSVSVSLSPKGFSDMENQTIWNGIHLEDFSRFANKTSERPMSIYKDENYQTSKLKQNLDILYVPLLGAMSNVKKCHDLLNGDEVAIGKNIISTKRFDKTVYINYLVAGYNYARIYDLHSEMEHSREKISKLFAEDREAKDHMLFLKSVNRLNFEI